MKVAIIALILSIVALGLASFATLTTPDNEGSVESVPITDRDILELYARTDYQGCIWDANMRLSETEVELPVTYGEYLAGIGTWAEYDVAYQAYQAAYDHYESELDVCWIAYVDASPYE